MNWAALPEKSPTRTRSLPRAPAERVGASDRPWPGPAELACCSDMAAYPLPDLLPDRRRVRAQIAMPRRRHVDHRDVVADALPAQQPVVVAPLDRGGEVEELLPAHVPAGAG